jgi:hypothetical protein
MDIFTLFRLPLCECIWKEQRFAVACVFFKLQKRKYVDCLPDASLICVLLAGMKIDKMLVCFFDRVLVFLFKMDGFDTLLKIMK